MEDYQTAHLCAIRRYFETFNLHDFGAAAALFSVQGELHPPFEDAIVGRAAIAAYLSQEASQMKLFPGEPTVDGSDASRLVVLGHVNAIAFKVGIKWTFLLTKESEIESLSIRLRASMQELLTLQK
ncbi:MAG: nuclear transport factor 2 family protein [Cyanobacteria bacterium P01_A01_bin.15]